MEDCGLFATSPRLLYTWINSSRDRAPSTMSRSDASVFVNLENVSWSQYTWLGSTNGTFAIDDIARNFKTHSVLYTSTGRLTKSNLQFQNDSALDLAFVHALKYAGKLLLVSGLLLLFVVVGPTSSGLAVVK